MIHYCNKLGNMSYIQPIRKKNLKYDKELYEMEVKILINEILQAYPNLREQLQPGNTIPIIQHNCRTIIKKLANERKKLKQQAKLLKQNHPTN